MFQNTTYTPTCASHVHKSQHVCDAHAGMHARESGSSWRLYYYRNINDEPTTTNGAQRAEGWTQRFLETHLRAIAACIDHSHRMCVGSKGSLLFLLPPRRVQKIYMPDACACMRLLMRCCSPLNINMHNINIYHI